MNSRHLEHALRKQVLLLESAQLRQDMALQLVTINPFNALRNTTLGRISGSLNWLRVHPISIALAVAAVVALRPRRVTRLLHGGIRLWKAGLMIASVWSAFCRLSTRI